MNNTVSFDKVLEMLDGLSMEEQVILADILHHRISEMNRQTIVSEVEKSRIEVLEGTCQPATAADIMKEIQS